MEDLDIPRANYRPPSLERVYQLYRTPAFWRGALSTRESLDADIQRTTLVHRLLAAAEQGVDVINTDDFQLWLARG